MRGEKIGHHCWFGCDKKMRLECGMLALMNGVKCVDDYEHSGPVISSSLVHERSVIVDTYFRDDTPCLVGMDELQCRL